VLFPAGTAGGTAGSDAERGGIGKNLVRISSKARSFEAAPFLFLSGLMILVPKISFFYSFFLFRYCDR
jgi:hypothetical protein